MSKVLDTFKTLRKQSRLLKVTGCLCLPFFCAGCLCCVPAVVFDEYKAKYEKVIRIYGGKDQLKLLAPKVLHEEGLFLATVKAINSNFMPTTGIDANITLLQVILEMHPRVNQLIRSVNDVSSLFLTHLNSIGRKSYIEALWNHYTNIGGNYHVIVYGLIEYLLHHYEPTSNFMEGYLDRFTTNSAMFIECMQHKSLAGM